MAIFMGIGTIATDTIRKETRNGVVTTFRLAAGVRGKNQIWIDVEAWGNLAGTVHQHGHRDRHVIVAGRITYKTWQDRATGAAQSRCLITATDIDLLPACSKQAPPELSNSVVAAGTVDTEPTQRPVRNGVITEFRLSCGRAGAKTGRLWIDVEHWSKPDAAVQLASRNGVFLRGRLAYRRSVAEEVTRGRYYLSTAELSKSSN